MRKLVSALSVLAMLAGAPLVAGCGADDLSPEDVAAAAASTRDERSARVNMRLTVSGFGLPLPLTVNGRGTSALDAAKMDMTFDLGPIMRLGGIQGDGRTRVVVLGKDLFVRPPAIEGFAPPEGRDWYGLDVRQAIEAMGLDAEALGALVNADPGAQLDALKNAKGMKKVGEEKIGDVETTRFRGEVRAKDLIAALPADRRQEAQEALDKLLRGAPGGDAPQPIEVWVDDDERIRRMSQTVRAPAQRGMQPGEAKVLVDYSDFGARVTAARPAAGDVFDATSAISRVLSQGAGAGVN